MGVAGPDGCRPREPSATDENLRAGVRGPDRRVGGAHQAAVEVRGDRIAHPAPAFPLRLEPVGLVGLVPHDVAIHRRAVARRDRAGEAGERPAIGLPAGVAARR